MISETKANEIVQHLIFLFEREFKLGRASVAFTGAVRFERESAFGLWYQLFEKLRGSKFDDKTHELLRFLRRNYQGKVAEDIEKSGLPKLTLENDEIDIILNEWSTRRDGE